MTVNELMSVNICFAKSDASVADAVSLMKQYDIGFVPVCDNKGCPLGVVTDRDILMRLILTDSRALSCTPVSEVMSGDIIAVSANMDVHDAACMFAHKKVRRLLVLENGKLIGILSLSDLSRKKLFLAEVGDIMGSLAGKQK